MSNCARKPHTIAKAEGIDLGLAILSTKPCPPGGRLLREIAAYCDCHHENIRQIEAKALEKLRRGLGQRGLGEDEIRASLRALAAR